VSHSPQQLAEALAAASCYAYRLGASKPSQMIGQPLTATCYGPDLKH
jgi:hypothetical protein